MLLSDVKYCNTMISSEAVKRVFSPRKNLLKLKQSGPSDQYYTRLRHLPQALPFRGVPPYCITYCNEILSVSRKEHILTIFVLFCNF